jgi:DNA-binding transcriptional ArsR family regulator
MNKDKVGQAERILRILHFLIMNGAKSYSEVGKGFPRVSQSTLERDMKLLKKTRLVVERKELKISDEKVSKKVFMFFKDDKDIVRNVDKAMENLKQDFCQVTLDQIASCSGLAPDDDMRRVAYALAPKLGLPIGREPIERPPDPLFVGAEEKTQTGSKKKRKAKLAT